MNYGYAISDTPSTGEFFLPLMSHDKPVPDADYLIGLSRTHVTEEEKRRWKRKSNLRKDS